MPITLEAEPFQQARPLEPPLEQKPVNEFPELEPQVEDLRSTEPESFQSARPAVSPQELEVSLRPERQVERLQEAQRPQGSAVSHPA